MGVINALGNTMGFVAPLIVGDIISRHNDEEHWKVENKRHIRFIQDLTKYQLAQLLSAQNNFFFILNKLRIRVCL